MTKVVINLCGVKSKGGITVFNNYLSQNESNKLYILYDNLVFKQYIENFDNEYIKINRIFQPFMSLFLNKELKKKINQYDYIIHFGNFGFKTNIKSYTLIQNILPLIKPFSSFRHFVLNILYRYSFRTSNKVLVQQKHVAELIPKKYETKIIGSIEIKNIKQSNNSGFITIYEDIKNKNPNFQIELLREISSKFDENITVVNLSIDRKNKIYDSNFVILENLDRNELLQVLNKQQETDDFSLRAPQDPFTEAGVIASQYNNIMDKLEQSENQKNIWKNRVSKEIKLAIDVQKRLMPRRTINNLKNAITFFFLM